MSKRESIVSLLLSVNEIFPEFSFSKDSISLYVEALEPIDFEKLKVAARKIVATNKCFPKPVEFIELATDC